MLPSAATSSFIAHGVTRPMQSKGTSTWGRWRRRRGLACPHAAMGEDGCSSSTSAAAAPDQACQSAGSCAISGMHAAPVGTSLLATTLPGEGGGGGASGLWSV